MKPYANHSEHCRSSLIVVRSPLKLSHDGLETRASSRPRKNVIRTYDYCVMTINIKYCKTENMSYIFHRVLLNLEIKLSQFHNIHFVPTPHCILTTLNSGNIGSRVTVCEAIHITSYNMRR